MALPQLHYNVFAGQSLDRLAALSDGVFAIAMTLLVLDLRVPPLASVHSESQLWSALMSVAPNVVAYLMSFLTLGIFWVGQQTQMNLLARSDRHFTWIHLAFLLMVATMPFSTALLAQFISFRIALVAYWLNIFLLGAALFFGLRHASLGGLFAEGVTSEMQYASRRRIYVAQALYAFGALLCVVSTYLSIAFIVLVQLNYAIAPQVPLLRRL
jgi:uncharacterized membrane protein